MFEKSSTIVRDAAPLDYDYIPERLIGRDGQMEELELLFTPLATQGRACSAMISGSVGTGKTVTARRFVKDMSAYCAKEGRPIDHVLVNCRNKASDTAVLQQIMRFFDPGHPDRGFSTDEHLGFLRKRLLAHRRPIVIVLDEADVLLKRTSIDIIYQLTRFSEGVEFTPSVSLILISQEPVYELLDEASRSTFRKSNHVLFTRYDRSQLRDIIKDRVDLALFPGVISEDAIDLLAENASDYGDARLAIELLDRASLIAEKDTEGRVTSEHVRAAKAMIYSAVPDGKLMSLDINRKAVLLAISRAIRKTTYIPTSAAEKNYAVVCEEYGIPCRKHTQFWTYVKDLEKQGIVRTYVKTDSEGRTTMISLPDVPAKVLCEKMEMLIESEKRGGVDIDEM